MGSLCHNWIDSNAGCILSRNTGIGSQFFWDLEGKKILVITNYPPPPKKKNKKKNKQTNKQTKKTYLTKGLCLCGSYWEGSISAQASALREECEALGTLRSKK